MCYEYPIWIKRLSTYNWKALAALLIIYELVLSKPNAPLINDAIRIGTEEILLSNLIRLIICFRRKSYVRIATVMESLESLAF